MAALAAVRSAFSAATSEDSVPTCVFRLSMSALIGFRSWQPVSTASAATAAIVIPIELFIFRSPYKVVELSINGLVKQTAFTDIT